MADDEKKSARQVHVEALRAEQAQLERRPDSDTKTRRLNEVSDELARFGERPGRRGGRQTAVNDGTGNRAAGQAAPPQADGNAAAPAISDAAAAQASNPDIAPSGSAGPAGVPPAGKGKARA